MIQPRKPHHYVQLAWWLSASALEPLIATGLYWSLPANDTLTGVLLLRIW